MPTRPLYALMRTTTLNTGNLEDIRQGGTKELSPTGKIVDGATENVGTHKPRDAIVSLLNGKQFSVHCDQGREITVEELLPKTLQRMEMENIEAACEVFALWVVSSSLQLQLKPHHQPFKIVKRWPELLSLFAKHANPESEVAMLYLKRRETVHQGMERDHKDPQIVELLFDEMTFNIVYSFYPCDLEDAILLAAIHLRMECGRGATVTKDDFIDCEGAQLPDHLTRKVSERVRVTQSLKPRASPCAFCHTVSQVISLQ